MQVWRNVIHSRVASITSRKAQALEGLHFLQCFKCTYTWDFVGAFQLILQEATQCLGSPDGNIKGAIK
jgi:hypothetical protein